MRKGLKNTGQNCRSYRRSNIDLSISINVQCINSCLSNHQFNNKMLNRLKQQNISIKPPKSPTPNKKSVSASKRNGSYSAMQRKKHNDSQLFDYELAWICDHLYQGCFSKNKKHGEGLLIQSDGVVIIGNWNKGLLDGYALVITPFGGKIHANYRAGKLSGWAIGEFANSFQIMRYDHDECHRIRRRYDESEQLWTEALYNPQGKLQKLLKLQKTKDYQLPSFIQDEQLKKLYDKVIMKGQTLLSIKKLNILKINDKFDYYGYVNDAKSPDGLGVIYSCNQIYAGNFKSGSLNQHGLILFQNGVIYKGEIYTGKIWGNGVIYDINLDQTKTVKVFQQGVEYVYEQEEGCKLDIVPFQVGKIPKMPADKGYTNSIDSICSQMTKYYYRVNSSMQYIESSESSQQGEQLKFSQNSQSSQKIAWSQKSQPETQTKKKKLNFVLPEASIKQINEQLHEDSLESSQMQQIKLIPSRGLPSSAPTFEQITKKTKSTEPKVMYPYLLEFQMSKNIFAPYKISQIGKIVANSLRIAEKYS